jgi:hypothetical protein
MWFGTSNGLDRYDAAKIWSFNQTGISVNGKWNSLAYLAVRYTPN